MADKNNCDINLIFPLNYMGVSGRAICQIFLLWIRVQGRIADGKILRDENLMGPSL
jgi:hypothetical protein